jgi:hypothetical protein
MLKCTMSVWLGVGIAAIVLVSVALWFLSRKRNCVYRNELPRVFELHDLVRSPRSAAAYFQDFEKSLAEVPQKLRQFRDIEHELEGLDTAAWNHLKADVPELIAVRDPSRGWQALFDILNQAKAYNYLQRIGCTNIAFIPRARAKGQKTPDLKAELGLVNVLCEVKTINVSEDEATRRQTGGVGTSTDRLESGFFRKLTSDLTRAKAQMAAHGADSATKMIAYVIINFDDLLHEYADRYELQINQYMVRTPVPGLEVVFDYKPAFYAAMS